MLAKKVPINKRCHWKYPSSFSSLLDVRNVLVLTLTLISQGKIRSGHLLVVYVTHRLTVHQNSRHTLDITVLYHASAEVEGTQHASNIEVYQYIITMAQALLYEGSKEEEYDELHEAERGSAAMVVHDVTYIIH